MVVSWIRISGFALISPMVIGSTGGAVRFKMTQKEVCGRTMVKNIETDSIVCRWIDFWFEGIKLQEIEGVTRAEINAVSDSMEL